MGRLLRRFVRIGGTDDIGSLLELLLDVDHCDVDEGMGVDTEEMTVSAWTELVLPVCLMTVGSQNIFLKTKNLLY